MDKSYLITNSDGLYDLLSDSVSFDLLNPLGTFKVTNDCIFRPDKISLLYYQTDEYWWAILRANNLGYGFRSSFLFRRPSTMQPYDYVISSLYLGAVINIPSISDINNFLNKIKGTQE